MIYVCEYPRSIAYGVKDRMGMETRRDVCIGLLVSTRSFISEDTRIPCLES